MNSMTSYELIGLPVVTQSGQELGKVKDFEIDSDTFKIIAIHVSPIGLLKKLVNDAAIISVELIIEVTPQQIIVEDSVVREGGRKVRNEEYSPVQTSTSNPIVSSK